MPVDVQTEVEINRSRSEVAAYAADPDNATAWWIAAPILAKAMRRANREDLQRIKKILESQPAD